MNAFSMAPSAPRFMPASSSTAKPSKSPPASAEAVAVLPEKSTEVLLKECRDLLHFLWKTSRAFDKRSVVSTNFDESFDWQSAREVRHVVTGKPGGKLGEVECSWLRVDLKGMNEVERQEEGPGELAEPEVSYHGTRWPKLPWILKDRRLKGGPREAGGKNGVWTSPSFKTAESYAWPEPLGSATSPHFEPWAHLEAVSDSCDRFQAVLELEILQRRKHSRSVYVTVEEKAALKALHFRRWRVDAEDHTELRQGYFPSSFMPDGARLWYVAGSEPKWLDNEIVELSDGTAVPKATKKRKKPQKKEEAEATSAMPPPSAPSPVDDADKRSAMIWKHVGSTINEDELRDKLGKYLVRTHQQAAELASAKAGPKPATFLLLWIDEAVRRLTQAAGPNLLQPSNLAEIVSAMKLMVGGGLVPAKVDAPMPGVWNDDLAKQIHDALYDKLE